MIRPRNGSVRIATSFLKRQTTLIGPAKRIPQPGREKCTGAAVATRRPLQAVKHRNISGITRMKTMRLSVSLSGKSSAHLVSKKGMRRLSVKRILICGQKWI